MRVEQIAEGQRVRFVDTFDCYPLVSPIEPGAEGTIVEMIDSPRGFWVSVDWCGTDVPFKSYDAEMWRDNRWPARGVEFLYVEHPSVLSVLEVVGNFHELWCTYPSTPCRCERYDDEVCAQCKGTRDAAPHRGLRAAWGQ